MTDVIGQPIYQRIAEVIRTEIASGQWPVGEPLPSTTKLMAIHKASNNVVRNAINLLEREGLVEGRPGKGVYVRATPRTAKKERASLKALEAQVAELRNEVQRLGEQQPAEVLAAIDGLRTDVGQIQADLRALYDRVGQPYPHDETAAKPRPSRGAASLARSHQRSR